MAKRAKRTKSAAKRRASAGPPVRIVEGAATMTGYGGLSARPGVAKIIEAAMAQAVTDALAAGISDPIEQKKRMLAARDRVLGRTSPAKG